VFFDIVINNNIDEEKKVATDGGRNAKEDERAEERH
jgi:hypothetical protein